MMQGSRDWLCIGHSAMYWFWYWSAIHNIGNSCRYRLLSTSIDRLSINTDWISMVSSTSPPVASLGLVSPGAATDGVTLFFLEIKLTTFFSVIALWKVMTFLAVVSSPLPSSHVVYPMFFLIQQQKIILFRYHSLDGVTLGGPPHWRYWSPRIYTRWKK